MRFLLLLLLPFLVMSEEIPADDPPADDPPADDPPAEEEGGEEESGGGGNVVTCDTTADCFDHSQDPDLLCHDGMCQYKKTQVSEEWTPITANPTPAPSPMPTEEENEETEQPNPEDDCDPLTWLWGILIGLAAGVLLTFMCSWCYKAGCLPCLQWCCCACCPCYQEDDGPDPEIGGKVYGTEVVTKSHNVPGVPQERVQFLGGEQKLANASFGQIGGAGGGRLGLGFHPHQGQTVQMGTTTTTVQSRPVNMGNVGLGFQPSGGAGNVGLGFKQSGAQVVSGGCHASGPPIYM